MATLAAPTLQALITSVRSFLNQPNRLNSFWSDDEITRYLNEGVSVYFQEVSLNQEGLFTTTSDLNIVANTETVALPSDCFEIRALYKAISGGYAILPYRNHVDEDYSTAGGTSAAAFFPSYFLRGNNIVMRPIPNFSETAGLKLEYIQFPDTMINGGDSMTTQVSPIFKQLIEMYAIYKAKLKESLVNGVIVHKAAEENLSNLYKGFKDAIARRSQNPTFVKPYSPELGG